MIVIVCDLCDFDQFNDLGDVVYSVGLGSKALSRSQAAQEAKLVAAIG